MRPSRRAPQSGAVLLTALVVVTLVATLAAGMVWQQRRAVALEGADRARAQADWILLGALDWARLILRADARANRSSVPVDHLGEVWATPLAEARLSTFLAVTDSPSAPSTAESEAPEAFLSGQIEDAQARYNLMNLAASQPDHPAENAVWQRVAALAGLRAEDAQVLAHTLRRSVQGDAPDAAPPTAAPPRAPSTAPVPLRPAQPDQLAWSGLDAASLARLAPWTTWLPRPTPLNLNTAPVEVLAAVLGLDRTQAQRLVTARQQRPFEEVAQARALLGPDAPEWPAGRVGVGTEYFVVHGRLRIDAQVWAQRSLLRRRLLTVEVLRRERPPVLANGLDGAS